MNDCPRQNPAYRLAQFILILPVFWAGRIKIPIISPVNSRDILVFHFQSKFYEPRPDIAALTVRFMNRILCYAESAFIRLQFKYRFFSH